MERAEKTTVQEGGEHKREKREDKIIPLKKLSCMPQDVTYC